MADRQSDQQAIRDRIRRWNETLGSKDGGQIARFYTRDAKFLVPNRPLLEGQDEIAEAWTGLLSSPNVSLSFGPTTVEIAEADDLGYDVGTYHLAFDGPQGRVEDRGKYVVIWRKEEGEWRAAVDILNTDNPLPG